MPDELYLVIFEGFELGADAFVDAQGTLAASDKQHDGHVRVEAKVLCSFFAWRIGGDVCPQRIAGQMDAVGGKPLLHVVISHTDGFGFFAHIAVGLARIGVLLLDDGGNV